MGEVGDEAHESNEQTESDAGDLAKCNGSSKIEMTVGVMLWGIYNFHNNIAVNRACSSIRYSEFLHNGWNSTHWRFKYLNSNWQSKIF